MTTTFKKSRARLTPSVRDQQIYRDYEVEGLKQVQLAKKYGVSQRRISQILTRVRVWLNATQVQSPKSNLESQQPDRDVNSTFDPRLSTFDSVSARSQLELQLLRDRLNFATREAARAWHQPQKTVTKKKGTRGDKNFNETTVRTAPATLQCLKVITQSTRQLIHFHAIQARSESEGPGCGNLGYDRAVGRGLFRRRPCADRSFHR